GIVLDRGAAELGAVAVGARREDDADVAAHRAVQRAVILREDLDHLRLEDDDLHGAARGGRRVLVLVAGRPGRIPEAAPRAAREVAAQAAAAARVEHVDVAAVDQRIRAAADRGNRERAAREILRDDLEEL